jgi:hypothetical protein
VGPSWVEPGAVFRWSDGDRPMRVIVHDGDVVMYDAWWPHLENWGLADLESLKRKRVSYYVVIASVLTEKATYVRSEALTGDERAVHRPDLPFAVVQDAVLSWPSEIPGTSTWPDGVCDADGCPEGTGLQASEIYLSPFGPKGGSKTGVRVKAANGTAFTVEELLQKAAAVEAPHVGDVLPVHGVGIYREGLQRGIPAFYLWGAESRLHG